MKNKPIKDHIDVIAAFAGLAIGVAAVLLSEHYGLNRSHLGYAICASCLGYLGTRSMLSKREPVCNKRKWRAANWLFLLGTALFLILLLASIIILKNSLYRRPPIYFGLFSAAIVLLVVQIALLDLDTFWKRYAILGQILVLGISLKAGAFFLYPSVSGNDPFPHQRWIEQVIMTGRFPQDTSYASFPAMHLVAGVVSLITDGSSKTGLFSISIAQSLILLSAFPIGKRLFGTRAGLMAALLLNLSDYQILWGVQIIPNTLGVVWFALVFMSLVTRHTSSRDTLGWTLSILLFFSVMVLTHTLSTLVLVVTLAALSVMAILQKVLDFKTRTTIVSSTLAVLSGIAMLAYWMRSFVNPGLDFFTRLALSIKVALSSAQVGNVEAVSVAGSLDRWTVFAGEIGWTLLLVPALAGALSTLRSRQQKSGPLVLSQLMTMFLVIIYGSGLAGAAQVLPSRWIAFLYIPACLLAADFLSRLLNASRLRMLVVSVVVVVLSATNVLMMTSPRAIPDSPLYAASLGVRPGFYTSELVGMEYAKDTYVGPYAASSRSRRFLYMADIIDPRQPDSYESANIIVIREQDINMGFFIPFAKHQLNETILPTQELIDHLNGPSRLRVYDDGSVQLFLSISDD